MDEQLKQYLLEKAQRQYEEQKVDPNQLLGASFGQALQGRPVDTEWGDKRNKLAYDETLGRLKLEQSEAEKRAEQQRQFDVEQAYKEKALRENIDARRELAKINRDSLSAQKQAGVQQRQAELQQKQTEAAKKNLPEERVKLLSGTDKARFDNALMAIKALDEMDAALNSGQNTFSLIGDNDYTAASRRATEAYGRMQSGGAINKEEESRFEKTLPGMTDTSEMQKKKIDTQRKEMISRLKTLGFSPEQVGLEQKASSIFPKQVFKDGKSATVKNEQELIEAQSEGWQ